MQQKQEKVGGDDVGGGGGHTERLEPDNSQWWRYTLVDVGGV